MREERSSRRPPAIVAVGLALMVGGYASAELGEHFQWADLQRARAGGDWITSRIGFHVPQHALTSAGVLAIVAGAVMVCAATCYLLLTTTREGLLREAALTAGATSPACLFAGTIIFGEEPKAAALVPTWVASPELTLICTPALCIWLAALGWRLRRPIEVLAVDVAPEEAHPPHLGARP